MNVYLTGFMGCGKSAVGKELARLLKRPFVDTDAEIERRAGMSVAEIFERKGEPAFRTLERAAVARAARKTGAVVALGGGALLDPRNRKPGALVRLTCAEGELWRRLKPEMARRPLLAGGRAAFRALLKKRRAAYAGAHFSVSTTRQNPEQAARAIARRLAA